MSNENETNPKIPFHEKADTSTLPQGGRQARYQPYQITSMDRMRYAFDNYMAKGTPALIGGLAVLSAALILVVAVFVAATQSAPEGVGFVQLVWMSLMRTLDAGTMGGDEGSWVYLLSMLFVTLGGVFVISTLIGILSAGVDAKLEELRKGRSRVIEKGHTVILGWSEQVFTILAELAIANENVAKPCVVVMGEYEKTDMEEEIRSKVENLGRLRVVCRRGNPMEITDLEIVNLNDAEAIIILSPEVEDPDSSVIKTMLAITRHPNRKPEAYHIVAQIRKPENMEVARMIAGNEVELILLGNIVARIVAQTCRQSGLSTVYTELMDFGGDEIYFKSEPGLTGKTYGEALLAYENSALIGLVEDGVVKLNPAMDSRLSAATQVIAISEDDDTITLANQADAHVQSSLIAQPLPKAVKPENVLILGWNWRALSIIRELDAYVPPGSTVKVVAKAADGGELLEQVRENLTHLTCTYQPGEITDRRTLDGLDFQQVDAVILLAYADELDVQNADSLTLITLLHLRDIADRNQLSFSIVSEMMDVRNQRLAAVTRADDFVVSNRLISLLMAQIAEEKRLRAVFEDIFDPEGADIYLKPAGNYVQLGEAVNFYSVVEAARRQGQTAIGYRINAHAYDSDKAYGVKLNPVKSQTVCFAADDEIIVFAED